LDQRVGFFEQFREFVLRNITWFLAGGLVLLALQDVFGTHGLIAMRRSHRQAADVQRQIDQINAENDVLQGRVKSLKTDPASIERIAREDMGLARPGEYIFKLPAKPGAPSAPAATPAQPAKP